MTPFADPAAAGGQLVGMRLGRWGGGGGVVASGVLPGVDVVPGSDGVDAGGWLGICGGCGGGWTAHPLSAKTLATSTPSSRFAAPLEFVLPSMGRS